MDKIDRLVKFIREEGAIVNNVGDGKIAGLPPDDPPVRKRDELMFAKPIKRKNPVSNWIKAAIKQGKKKKGIG